MRNHFVFHRLELAERPSNRVLPPDGGQKENNISTPHDEHRPLPIFHHIQRLRHQATYTNNFVRFALRVRPVYVCPSDMTVSSPIDPRSNCTSAKQIMLELLFFFAGDKLVKFLSRLLVYSLFEWFETIISILRSCCRLYLGAPRDHFSFLNYTFFMRFN